MKYQFFTLLVLSIFILSNSLHAQGSSNLNEEAAAVAQKNTTTKVDTAQKTPWVINNKAVVTAEEAFYKNWTKDGFNSLAFTAIFLGKYNYITDLNKWENTIDLAFGLMAQDLDGDGKLDESLHPHKTDDKLNFTSSYSRKAFENFNYNATFDFRSQFSETYKDDSILTANIFAPAYLLTAIGMTYENKGFAALVAPITGKITLVTDERLSAQGVYGLQPGEKSLWEFGAYSKLTFSSGIVTNVSLDTKLEFFYDYASILFKDTYINWEVLINMKVNKYLSAFFAMQTIYDNKVTQDIQFKEKLGLMLAVEF